MIKYRRIGDSFFIVPEEKQYPNTSSITISTDNDTINRLLNMQGIDTTNAEVTIPTLEVSNGMYMIFSEIKTI